MSPQLTGHLTERALAAGALDIYYTPVQMKKNRNGLVISLVAGQTDRERLSRLLFEETTTIGVRIHTAERRGGPPLGFSTFYPESYPPHHHLSHRVELEQESHPSFTAPPLT
jgi:hypothetical protein